MGKGENTRNQRILIPTCFSPYPALCDRIFFLPRVPEQDEPAQVSEQEKSTSTCSLILLCTLRSSNTNFVNKNPFQYHSSISNVLVSSIYRPEVRQLIYRKAPTPKPPLSLNAFGNAPPPPI